MGRHRDRQLAGNEASVPARRTKRPSWRRRLAAAHRPAVEPLEQRVVLSPTIYTVNATGGNTVGSGTSGTLPYVISQANADANIDGAEIIFDPSLFSSPQLITLAGTLTLSETPGPEVIDGPGAGLLTISGGNAVGVFEIASGVTASLSGVTISGGSTTGDGGGLLNDGIATLIGCTISGSSAAGSGGGLYSDGTLTLTGCTISGNTAGQGGGGVSVYGRFGGNTYATLSNCNLTGNSAYNNGGGLYCLNQGGATATLSDCNITGNYAAGGGGVGFFDEGTLTGSLTDCTISGNSAHSGGGLLDEGVPTGTLQLYGCEISDNTADFEGGGMDSLIAATLTDCTISGNSAAMTGGGIDLYASPLTLTDCTISGNTASGGAGLYANQYLPLPPYVQAATATLTDTIIAGNVYPYGDSSDIGGDLAGNVTGSYNLVGTGGSGGIQDGSDGNIVLSNLDDLDLGPLANNGGPTRTMALLPGSAAIHAGTAVVGVTTDQRGDPLDSPPDIGAYQLQGQSGPLVFTVTTTADSGDGSLREAIDQADSIGRAATIAFAIGGGQQTINLLSPLPAITAPVTIDGTTQPGYSGAPLIELDGARAGSAPAD